MRLTVLTDFCPLSKDRPPLVVSPALVTCSLRAERYGEGFSGTVCDSLLLVSCCILCAFPPSLLPGISDDGVLCIIMRELRRSEASDLSHTSINWSLVFDTLSIFDPPSNSSTILDDRMFRGCVFARIALAYTSA
ncbi:hypothetical protein SCHPADRAFT_163226 [Schizopora paradoxa]|uniref:Uncharacterized protein n=1 Tax=Schizopora paradoxa TaxID=27342 RepID=A0A0H2S0H9_9AGAM|nr:hypothetical protein SCHPADRAFT_163226 [Schizopora paradoxa]